MFTYIANKTAIILIIFQGNVISDGDAGLDRIITMRDIRLFY
jgi:hypothetical protein